MLLDTNILVRHLTGEPADQAARATTFLREAEALEVPALIVAELVYVLESVYEQTRPQVAAHVRSVLAHPPVHVAEESALLRAIELYEVVGVHFAEAYLASLAEQRDGLVASLAEQRDGLVASFDRDLDRVSTVTRIGP